jgi:hypothetical protein
MLSILKIKKYTYIRDFLTANLKFKDIKYYTYYIQYNEMIKKTINDTTIVYFVYDKKPAGSIMNFCIV